MDRKGVRQARLFSLGIAVLVLVATMALSGAAFAAESTNSVAMMTAVQLDALFSQLQAGPVYESICLRCHANIANTKNYSSEIIFSHGNHIRFECSSCHPKFPHQAAALTSRPTMKACWNCHGLYHGGMGIVASGKCEDCHKTPKSQLRPSSHTYNWKFQPHVEPGKKELNTRCMMCHDQAWCDDCHTAEGIKWAPENGNWDYDAEDGCLACHGQATLQKQGANGPQSFLVDGLDVSAHKDLSCQQCHVDFNYEDRPGESQQWRVNAGLACAECHDHDKQSVEYKKSIHYKKLMESEGTSLTAAPTLSSPGDQPVVPATCASCHGGHYVQKLETDFQKQVFHAQARRVCATVGCHVAQYTSYNDYYHGKAYKQGAPDAPACWECHGTHNIQPAENPESMVSQQNLPETCGQEGCHKGSEEAFTENAGELIHRQVEAQQSNPVRQFISNIFARF